jgi:hypothetical protein
MRGPNSYLGERLWLAANYGVRVSEDAIKLVMLSWRDAAVRGGWNVGRRRTLVMCCEMKRLRASVGEPFDRKFANFEHLAQIHSPAVISGWVEELMEVVERGGLGHCPLFRGVIKPDKYSLKKSSTGEWRPILVADVLCLFLHQHLFAEMAECAESVHERIGINMTPRRWRDIVVERLARKPTAGVDYARYDETEASQLLYRISLELCEMVGCSFRLSRYVARTVACGWAVTAGGEVIERAGGNPSGQFLTAVLNSLVHEIINFDCWGRVLEVPPSEVLAFVDWCVVGDDELVAPPSVESLLEFIVESEGSFGIACKSDLCAGRLYPPGCHASFLSRVSLRIRGYDLLLPSEPTRLLSAWQVPARDEVSPVDTYRGLAAELWGYRVILECGLEWPVPTPVRDFLCDAREFEKESGELVLPPLSELVASRMGYQFD